MSKNIYICVLMFQTLKIQEFNKLTSTGNEEKQMQHSKGEECRSKILKGSKELHIKHDDETDEHYKE